MNSEENGISRKEIRRKKQLLSRESAASGRVGAPVYKPSRRLVAKIDVGQTQAGNNALTDTVQILSKLRRALRAERRKGHAGHWSYDMNRHIALRRAILSEMARLEDHHPPEGRRLPLK